MSIFVKQDRLNQRLCNRIRWNHAIEDIRKVLDDGADAKAQGKDSYYTRPMIYWAAEGGREDIIKLLLERGADPNGTSSRLSPLMAAVRSGSTRAVEALLQAGAKPENKEYDGETPLLHAAKNGQGDIVRALVEHGADINVRTSAGETALHLVAAKGHAKLVKYLMDKGADITAANVNMNTPADVAEKDFPRIADMIKGTQAPALPAPAVLSDWSLTEPDEVARVKDKALIGYRVTEIFNFSAKLFTQIARNLDTGAESQTVKGFTELGDGSAVEAAHAALVKLGGKVNTLDKVKLPGPGQGT